MVEPPDPEITIIGDDRLSDAAVEALARLLLEAADQEESTE